MGVYKLTRQNFQNNLFPQLSNKFVSTLYLEGLIDGIKSSELIDTSLNFTIFNVYVQKNTYIYLFASFARRLEAT